MRANTPSALRLGLFWLGIQAVWGALLGISLQARTIELVAGSNALIAYGRLATIGALVAAVVQIAVGPFSDARRRHGSRRIEFYVAGTAIAAFALAGFFAAGNFTALTLAFVALQAGLNFAIGPYQAIIPDAIPRSEFGRASSWMAALQSAGNALGAVLAAYHRRRPDPRVVVDRAVGWNGSGDVRARSPYRAGTASAARAVAFHARLRRFVRVARTRLRRVLHAARIFAVLRYRSIGNAVACGGQAAERRADPRIHRHGSAGSRRGRAPVGSFR